MAFTFAGVGAIVGMSVGDYYQVGRNSFLRLHEKGSKEKDAPTQRLEQYLDEYLAAAGIADDREGPLFRSAMGRARALTVNRLRRTDVWAMVRGRGGGDRRRLLVPLVPGNGNHDTTFLENGGILETAQYIAGHAHSRTTKLYDRRAQRATREDIERIRY